MAATAVSYPPSLGIPFIVRTLALMNAEVPGNLVKPYFVICEQVKNHE